jgi:hypothetical protein
MSHTEVACTLGSEDLSAQTARWKKLGARAGAGRVPAADGLRLIFRREAGVEEELQELVAIERSCCSWADWSVEGDAGEVVLDVRATGEGVTALHGMFVGI